MYVNVRFGYTHVSILSYWPPFAVHGKRQAVREVSLAEIAE